MTIGRHLASPFTVLESDKRINEILREKATVRVSYDDDVAIRAV